MYIQITTRCNMECAHCGMNCTAEGVDMSFETFKAAINYTDLVTIGGGEPTIHPEFEKFLFYSIAHCEYVHLFINGKIADTALALARISKEDDVVSVQLSQDPYHEAIDDRVVKAFKGRIRDTSSNLINAGRCDFGNYDTCICEGFPFVKPNGDVYQCGCDAAPKVGDVFEGFCPLDGNEEWICYKKIS